MSALDWCDDHWMCPREPLEFTPTIDDDKSEETITSIYFLYCTQDANFFGNDCQSDAKIDAFLAQVYVAISYQDTELNDFKI